MMGELTVLVITSSPEISNVIQQTLDVSSGYTVILASNLSESFEFAHKTLFSVCILDALFPNYRISWIVKELKKVLQKTPIILILPNNEFSYPNINGIASDGFLCRSFSPAELITQINLVTQPMNITTSKSTQQNTSSTNSNEGFSSKTQPMNMTNPLSKSEELNNLSQRLASLSLKSSAQALIILRRKQLIAQASVLPDAAIHELVDLINSYSKVSAQNLQKQISPILKKAQNGDMVRFIQLESTQDKYLLYVISLTRELLLALLYDHDTQFKVVRRQTWQIAHDLLSQPPTPTIEYRTPTPTPRAQQLSLSEKPVVPQTTSEPNKESLPIQPSEPLSKLETPTRYTWVPEYTTPQEMGKLEEEIESSTEERIIEPIEKVETKSSLTEEENNILYHDSSELDENRAGEPLGFEPLSQEQDTVSTSESTTELISQTPVFGHYITYSCLLIPRMPQHLLTSNLASYLFKWMGQLCLAYGWRLEHLSIHSDYIHWVAGAPLAISPAFLIRTMRQKTSDYIFSQFPPLTNENPSGDFWAPGFFISGGRQTIQSHIIEKYIREIRDQQGIPKSISN